MGRQTFGKNERLKSEKLIEELFSKGSAFNMYPFRVVSLVPPAGVNLPGAQVLFSVPSRNFKLAVDRNKIRRRSREAYRLTKQNLHMAMPILIAFVYTAREIESFDVIRKSMEKILKNLSSGLA